MQNESVFGSHTKKETSERLLCTFLILYRSVIFVLCNGLGALRVLNCEITIIFFLRRALRIHTEHAIKLMLERSQHNWRDIGRLYRSCDPYTSPARLHPPVSQRYHL